MNYKKTIRLFEPFGGWGAHHYYYRPDLLETELKDSEEFSNTFDTGLCNRLLNWEAIYYIVEQAKDNDLHISVQNHIWPELALIELPDTVGVDYNIWNNFWYGRVEHGNLYFKTIFDIENNKVSLAEKLSKNKVINLYKTKNFKDILQKDHWYTDTGFLTLKSLLTLVHKMSPEDKTDTLYPNPRPLGKIELKDRAVQKKLDEKFSSYIGIHIRRAGGVHIKKENFDKFSDKLQKEYLRHRKGSLDKFNPHYRYTSDNEYFKIIDKILEINPKQKFYISHDLPDEFLADFYKKYPKNIESKKDVRKHWYNYYKKKISNLDHLIKYANILDNTLDLFILSICGFKILSKASTWSMFADFYQRPHTPPKAEKNYFIDDIQQLIDNPKELGDILAKLPPPQNAL